MTWYILQITPQSALRPTPVFKRGRVSMLNKPKYTAYKNTLAFLCRGKNVTFEDRKIEGIKIPKGDYYKIEAYLYKPYPKATPKYKRIEGAVRRKIPDWDNEMKALQDAIVQAKIITDDGIISDGIGRKRWTTEEHGRIEFRLKLYEEKTTKS